MAQECVLVQTFAEAADEMSVETIHLVAKKLLMKGLMGEGKKEVKKDREANEEMTKTALKMELDQKCAHSSPAQPKPPRPTRLNRKKHHLGRTGNRMRPATRLEFSEYEIAAIQDDQQRAVFPFSQHRGK